jgi:hypothetical protein
MGVYSPPALRRTSLLKGLISRILGGTLRTPLGAFLDSEIKEFYVCLLNTIKPKQQILVAA